MRTGKKTPPYVAPLLFLCSLLCPAAAAGQASAVESIEVESSWGGFGPSSESKLHVKQKGGKFSSEGESIDGSLVEDLLRELEVSSDLPTLAGLGISEEWLQANAESALPEALKDADQSEKNLFLDSFRDARLVEKLLPAILRGGWTDDYPKFELRIRMKDGSTIRVVSDRQNVLKTMTMLGAEDFAARVGDRLAESAFIQISEPGRWSRWVVLPGGSTILFDFQGDRALNWRREDLTTRNRYDTKYWHAARVLISPAGNVELR